eukprot:scaffold2396_cov86-Skeletonema_marinoi.AAC.3
MNQPAATPHSSGCPKRNNDLCTRQGSRKPRAKFLAKRSKSHCATHMATTSMVRRCVHALAFPFSAQYEV